ncbi:hypothetical protein L2E82_51982 [Cichorium intybus]|nr:hypothetical protein L2E82_51982 [Cichorium intybus]
MHVRRCSVERHVSLSFLFLLMESLTLLTRRIFGSGIKGVSIEKDNGSKGHSFCLAQPGHAVSKLSLRKLLIFSLNLFLDLNGVGPWTNSS